MKFDAWARHAVALALVFASAQHDARAGDKADPCAAPPYGMTPAGLAFWKEGVIDQAKAVASIQDVCRMKFRQTSRSPLHELGITDDVIDRASPLSLLYQSIGAGRFAAQLTAEPNPARVRKDNLPIRTDDIEASEQRFQRAVYDLSFNGELSKSLQTLGRFGVPFQDQQGHARDFGDVVMDTAAALQRVVTSGRMTKQEAEFAAREAGFHGSVATAIARNDPGLRSAIDRAKAAR